MVIATFYAFFETLFVKKRLLIVIENWWILALFANYFWLVLSKISEVTFS